jgi:hypothetical protein
VSEARTRVLILTATGSQKIRIPDDESHTVLRRACCRLAARTLASIAITLHGGAYRMFERGNFTNDYYSTHVVLCCVVLCSFFASWSSKRFKKIQKRAEAKQKQRSFTSYVLELHPGRPETACAPCGLRADPMSSGGSK